jgi:uncharacterized protein with von Willebrand factor type A (vWA) domain
VSVGASLAAAATGFDRALRAAGVRAGMRRAAAFAEVLARMPPRSREELYWRARTALLPAIDDLPAFERAFAAYFGAGPGGALAAAPPPSAPAAPRVERRAPPPSDAAADPASAAGAPIGWIAASAEERLAERSFDELTPSELAALAAALTAARVPVERRPSRRRRGAVRGDRFDLRGSLRAAARSGGEVLRRRFSRPRERVRPLLFLLDVSGSMEPFARALLLYARVAAVGRPRVRTFAFATRLTEITALLRAKAPAALLDAVGASVRDYGGGTRIGAALAAFNAAVARRGGARGGTVVILSDGWERDDPAAVGRELARLRRLTRRIVWVNPQKRHRGYEPLAGGMAAALPFVDAFLSGHSLRSLADVAAAIAGVAPPGPGLGSRRGASKRPSIFQTTI